MNAAASVPIALDAMGGDCGVQPLVEGALRAIADDGARLVLVGRRAEVVAALNVADARWQRFEERGDLSLVHADDVVTMDDKPADAARKKKQSSMRVACDVVADGAANRHAPGINAGGMLSMGNTGALLATALLAVGRLPGVARPAIATILPSLSPSGRTLLVDAGANSECEPLHLAQWGVLGSVYLQFAFGQQRPAIGVLSNGEEDTKGTPLVREALALLRQTDLNVVGFCEGRDLNAGAVHVVVTDGFTGNVVLKTAEGVFSFMSAVIKRTFSEGTPVDQLGGLLSKPGWARIKRELDPREFGAAPLLGLRRPVFIGHGKSDAHAVRCGLRAVRRFVDTDVTERLVEALASLPEALAHRRVAAAVMSTSEDER
jgi:glycerol-3-phosphate acyltransferase PlsX